MKTFDFRNVPRRPGQNGKPGDLAVPILDANERPFIDQLGRPVHDHFVLRDFLLARTGDAAFVAGLSAVEAMELQLETRKAIKVELALNDGLVALEDTPAQRLANAILKPVSQPYEPASAACLYPFVLPAKDPRDGNLRELERRAVASEEAAAKN